VSSQVRQDGLSVLHSSRRTRLILQMLL